MTSPLIDAATLRGLLGMPSLRIVDARFELAATTAGRAAYDAAHVPGAVYAHLDEDLSDHARPAVEGRHPLPSAARFAATLARWSITPDTPVVVYDAAGGALAAARVWWLLRWMGHEKVRVLDGGWQAWQAIGGPVDAMSMSPVAGGAGIGDERDPLAAGWRPGSVPVAAFDEVARPTPGTVLIDARAPERFRGEVEPLDPKAGHIPGARNRPFAANLEAGVFKPVDVLKREWAALAPLGTTPVLYCGSGVTACHNALALVQAGWPMPALFAPSWSGWVSDPTNPVAVGEA